MIDVLIRKREYGTFYDVDIRNNGSSVRLGCGVSDPADALIGMGHAVAPHLYKKDYRLLDFNGEPLRDVDEALIKMAIGHAMMYIEYPDVLEERVLH